MDATALSTAFEAPTLTVPRRPWGPRWFRALWLRAFGATKTYTGRILGHDEWLPFEPVFRDVDRAVKADEEDAVFRVQAAFEQYLDAIGIPAREVFRLPTGLVLEAMKDFLACQRRAMEPRRTQGSTSGRPSPRRAGGRRRDSTIRHFARAE